MDTAVLTYIVKATRRLLRQLTRVAIVSASMVPCANAQSIVSPSVQVKTSVVIRVSPAKSAKAIDRLGPSETAVLDADVGPWRRIRLADGREGYVSKRWTTVLPQRAIASIGSYRVHVIDVGTGLSIFVEGDGLAMLYDAGSQDDLAKGPDNRVLAYIAAVKPGLTVIDHLILSHPHKDHLELMPDVFAKFAIRNVWDSGTVQKTLGYCRFLRSVAAEPGVLYHDAIATGGTHSVSFSTAGCKGTIRIAQAAQMSAMPVTLAPGASMQILYRDASAHDDPNENSVVVRLDLGGVRVLLAGDAEAGDRQLPSAAPAANSIEAMLLACCRADLKADVLVVGHHSSLTSSRRTFLDAVGASTDIISSGPHAYSGVVLPDPEIRTELGTRGQVFETDRNDETCGSRIAKVGPDADESPGGCDNVVVTVAHGSATTAYSGLAD